MKAYINAIKWEIILDIKEYIRYRMGLVSDIIVFTSTFIAIYFFGVSSGLSAFYQTSENKGSILMLIGYIFWQNASAALGYLSGTIANETELGIFEMRLQSKFAVEGILFCRLLISCIIHVITYVGIIVFCGIVVGYDARDIWVIFLSILLSFPALMGMYGLGLILGCVSVIEKNVGSLIFLVQTILLFISNVLSPSRGEWVNWIPFSCGIDIVRNIYMNKNISIESIITYIMMNLVWIIIGIICFRNAIKYERVYGTFENY